MAAAWEAGRAALPELRLASSARLAASDVGGPLDRPGRGAGAGDRGAAARRLRLVGLRLRAAGGAGARAGDRAGAPARRVPRGRRAAGGAVHDDAGRARGAARPISARAGRRTCGRCCGAWRVSRGTRARRRTPGRCRGPGCTCRAGGWWRLEEAGLAGRPVVPILFYRSMLLAGDVAPIDALAARWRRRASRRCRSSWRACGTRASVALVEEVVARLRRAALVSATAFASAGRSGRAAVRPARACRCSRWCRRRRGARPGRAGSAASRRRIWRCMWCCPSSTAGSWPGRCRSRQPGGRHERLGSQPSGEPARARPDRAGGAADRGVPAAARDAAGGAPRSPS